MRNILIDNNLLDLKRITINIAKKSTYIESCNTTIEIEIKITRIVVYKYIYTRKVVDILSRLKITILVYYIVIFNNRDFLFKSNNTDLLLYAYIINTKTINILIKNKSNKIVYISRNCYLDRVLELDFLNTFQIQNKNNNITKLALQKTSINYKQK